MRYDDFEPSKAFTDTLWTLAALAVWMYMEFMFFAALLNMGV